MLTKQRLKLAGSIAAIFNIISLILFDFGSLKVSSSFLGYQEKSGFKLNEAEPKIWFWLLILIPILYIAIPFLKAQIEKYEKALELGLPILGVLLSLVALISFKSDVNSYLKDMGAIGGIKVSISWALGIWLSLLSYIVMFASSLMSSENVDLGNEKLNSFVNKASSSTSEFTEKAINFTSDKIKEIKEVKEVETKEIEKEEIEIKEVSVEEVTSEETIVDNEEASEE